jgi:hypothetical protein
MASTGGLSRLSVTSVSFGFPAWRIGEKPAVDLP